MAAIVLVSLCAVGVSALSVSAAQGSSNVKGPLVGAPVGAGAPGVCSVDGRSLDLLIRGADNALYLKTSPDGVSWTSPAVKIGPSGTALASAPAATSPGTLAVPSTLIEVFARGTDGRLYELTSHDSGATWSTNWIVLGGQLLANTGPSATNWLSGSTVHTELFVTGTNHQCYQMSQTSPSATVWHSLGGYLTSAPSATALSDGSQIGLFVAGTNSALYYKHYTTSWTGWVSIGGTVLAGTSPAAYNWGTNQIGWLVTGTDSQLYRNWAGSSSGYENVHGVLTSSPSATAKVPGVIDVFARGSTGQFAALYQNSFNYPAAPNTWGTWTALGGV